MEAIEHPMPQPRVRERTAFGANGLPMLGVVLVLIFGGIAVLIVGIARLADRTGGALPATLVVAGSVAFVAGLLLRGGLMMVAPGEARVVQFLGRYVGTVREDGLRWINPFTARRRTSTRIRHHETAVTKVNDADGSPIEIAAVVVWRVTDTARAMFEVDDYQEFVTIQTETAVRHIATSYPYDSHGGGRWLGGGPAVRGPRAGGGGGGGGAAERRGRGRQGAAGAGQAGGGGGRRPRRGAQGDD